MNLTMISSIKPFFSQKKSQSILLFQFLLLVIRAAPYQSLGLGCLILIQGVMPALAIRLSASIIDRVASGNYHFSVQELMSLGSAWAFTLLAHDLLNPWVMLFQNNIADKAVAAINVSIIEKANAIQGLSIFENQEFHNTIQVIQSQAHHKPLNLIVTLVGLAKDLVIALSCVGLLCTQIQWIGILAFGCALIHFKVFSAIQTRTWQESLGRSSKSRFLNYIAGLSVNVACAKEMRLFPIRSYLLAQYRHIFAGIYMIASRMRFKHACLSILPLTISVIGNVIAFYVVLERLGHGTISFGGLALILQSLAQLHISVAYVGDQSSWIAGHLLFFEKYDQFLKAEETVFHSTQKEAPIILQKASSSFLVTFDNVSFAYPDGRRALSNINFTWKPGERIAIVGANGSGKTTLIKLLCGFYPPTSGHILINNTPLEKIDLESWRAMISPVLQDFSPYYFTVKENILMGETHLNKEHLDQVIQTCQLRSLIDSLPEDLEHKLGQAFGGTDLSGGQWQKIAIARALYKEAPLYLLDEPTAALDPLTEYEIFQLFDHITRGKQVIFVTHRLGSITMADRILLLDKGRLLAEGSHSQLMEHSALYQQMFEAQASAFDFDKDTSLEEKESKSLQLVD